MKITEKRPHASSEKARIIAAGDAAAGPLAPPDDVHLREEDWPYWYRIMQTRPRSTWTAADLALAAKLARLHGDIDKLNDQLAIDGLILGTKAHPAAQLKDQYMRTALAYTRALRIDAGSTVAVQSRDLQKQATMTRSLEADDELIPTLGTI